MTATRHGHYGIDAPHVLYGLAAAALGATAATLIALTAYDTFNAAFAAIAVVFALITTSWCTGPRPAPSCGSCRAPVVPHVD